jgi:hypothetical protein
MKPEAAIERMRGGDYWAGNGAREDQLAILAYLDSLKPWPADLTRERLMELAIGMGFESRSDALRRLAELAPEREKRMVTLWQHETDGWQRWTEYEPENYAVWLKSGWRKVGECEVDA